MIWLVLFIGLSTGYLAGVAHMAALRALNDDEEPTPPHPERQPSHLRIVSGPKPVEPVPRGTR